MGIANMIQAARMVETMQEASCGEACCGWSLQHAEDRDAVLDLFIGESPALSFHRGLEGEEVILLFLSRRDKEDGLVAARLTMWA